MGVHEFPILNPPPSPSPYHPSGSSQCTSPKHPVSCIKPGLAIHFTYDNIHVSMPFFQIIPPLPSPTESKSLFYISVSLLLSRIQGYHYHLSKLHIYVLKVKSLSRVKMFATPWIVAHQAPLSMEFSRLEYWSGLPFPSPGDLLDPGIEPRRTYKGVPKFSKIEKRSVQTRLGMLRKSAPIKTTLTLHFH